MAAYNISGTHSTIVVLEHYAGFTSFYANGTINVTNAVGVFGDASAAWTLANAGLIAGTTGLFFQTAGAPGTVSNIGTIAGTTNTGVVLDSGGSVNNQGVIQGANTGIFVNGGSGNVTNTATIAAATNTGVTLDAGGSVNNQGAILGANTGLFVQGGSGTVANTGMLVATTGVGRVLDAGGNVSNQGVSRVGITASLCRAAAPR